MQAIHMKDDIGALSIQIPSAAQIFVHHGIDFCCSGSITFSEACLAQNLDAWEVRREIKNSLRNGNPVSWMGRSNEALVDFIVERFHRPLLPRLATIKMLLNKCINNHGDVPTGKLGRLRRLIANLSAEIVNHLQQEEALFPAIVSDNGRLARIPVRIMQREHDAFSTELKALREMTLDFTVPAGSCVAVHALYSMLSEFTDDMYRHIHLENNILFRRVLREERLVPLTRATDNRPT